MLVDIFGHQFCIIAVMRRTDSFMNRTVAKQENSTGHGYLATGPEVE
jgi:hypothetical protein